MSVDREEALRADPHGQVNGVAVVARVEEQSAWDGKGRSLQNPNLGFRRV